MVNHKALLYLIKENRNKWKNIFLDWKIEYKLDVNYT